MAGHFIAASKVWSSWRWTHLALGVQSSNPPGPWKSTNNYIFNQAMQRFPASLQHHSPKIALFAACFTITILFFFVGLWPASMMPFIGRFRRRHPFTSLQFRWCKIEGRSWQHVLPNPGSTWVQQACGTDRHAEQFKATRYQRETIIVIPVILMIGKQTHTANAFVQCLHTAVV